MITAAHDWYRLPDQGLQMLGRLYHELTMYRSGMEDGLAVILAGQADPLLKVLHSHPPQARANGRDPDQLLILPGLYPVIGSTQEEALRRKAEMDSLLDLKADLLKLAGRLNVEPERLQLDRPIPDDVDGVGGTGPGIAFTQNLLREARLERLTVRELLGRNPFGGHRLIVGTPEQLADEMESWFRTGAADGFNLNMDAFPSGLELFVGHVVPELQRRGLFRREYEGTTLRDHLGLDRPASQYQR